MRIGSGAGLAATGAGAAGVGAAAVWVGAWTARAAAGCAIGGASSRASRVVSASPLIGSRGSAQVDDHTNTQLAYVGGDGPTGLTVGEGVRHLAAMLDDFASAIAEQRDFSSTVTDALHTLDVVAALQKSLKTHEPVTLEPAEAVR